MDVDFLKTIIQPEVMILIPALYLIGLFLRQTPKIPRWIDVWVKLILATIACVAMIGFKIDAFIQGALVTGGAVLVKDLIERTAYGVQNPEKNEDKHV